MTKQVILAAMYKKKHKNNPSSSLRERINELLAEMSEISFVRENVIVIHMCTVAVGVIKLAFFCHIATVLVKLAEHQTKLILNLCVSVA